MAERIYDDPMPHRSAAVPPRDGFVDIVGPRLERSPVARALYFAAPSVLAALSIGIGLTAGNARRALIAITAALFVVILIGEAMRQTYQAHRRESMDTDAAARDVTLRTALRPIADATANMQAEPRQERQTHAHHIAELCATALALTLARTADLRSVAYVRDDDGLAVVAYSGRSVLAPGRFNRGTKRGDAVLGMLETRRPCFVRDVDDHDEVAKAVGAYAGSRSGYKTFISAPVADGRQTYGMLTVDAPRSGDLLESDMHLVMLVADMLAIAYASVRRGN